MVYPSQKARGYSQQYQETVDYDIYISFKKYIIYSAVSNMGSEQQPGM